MVYPKSEDKEDLFVKVTENISSHLIPDGAFVFDHLKKSDKARVTAKTNVNNGCWCILKGEILLQLDLYYSLYVFVYCSWKLRKQNITNSLNNANSQDLLIVEFEITRFLLFYRLAL